MNKLATSILALFSTIILVLAFIPTAQAAPSGLYLTPDSGNYAFDSSFSVQLRLSSSKRGVNTHLGFDASKLSVMAISTVGSAYSNLSINYDNSTGSISVYSTSGSGSGDVLVAIISFHAIGPGSTANVNFAGTNQTMSIILLIQVWTSVSTNNASYTIAAAPTPPPSAIAIGNTTSPSNPNYVIPPANTDTTTPSTAGIPPVSEPSPNTGSTDPPTEQLGSDGNSAAKLPRPNPTPSYAIHLPSPVRYPFTYLPALIAVVLTLSVIAIFASYRRTQMVRSIYRLIATATLTNLFIRDGRAVLRALSFLNPLQKIPPVTPNPFATTFFAFTNTKLLASGVKKRLLLRAGKSSVDNTR